MLPLVPLRRRQLGQGLLACLVTSACRSPGAGGPMVLNLVYAPSEPPDRSETVGLRPIPGIAVWIDGVRDQRTQREDIGISLEGNNTPVKVSTTGPSPADFVRSVVAAAMPSFEIPVASDVATATHTLQMDLLKFWATEGSTYAAELMVDARLVDGRGAVVWSDSLASVNRAWGKTFREELYLETLSDAAVELTQDLALSEGFRAALSRG